MNLSENIVICSYRRNVTNPLSQPFTAMFLKIPTISTLSRNNTVYSGFIHAILPLIIALMKKTIDSSRTLLGRRIRTLRTNKKWTQQNLGDAADINYKFLGEIERGRQNPSFTILEKIAAALGVDLHELFRFEHEVQNRKDVEARMAKILKIMSEDDLKKFHLIFHILYPIH
jgi:transcriptional regulator with XRE-family HTH domain